MHMCRIKSIADDLFNKYKTRNPFEIAKFMNINVTLWDFHDEINGLYKYERRNRFIYINNNLSEEFQLLVCAHELGHAILHSRYNTPFMRKNTLLSVSRIEIEANTFAAELLISDDLITNNKHLTTQQLASLHNVPEEIVMLKCKGLL